MSQEWPFALRAARLRGLQFRLDGIRRLSLSPLGATVKIDDMMWLSFFEMNDRLQGMARMPLPQRAGPVLLKKDDSVRREAKVIAFRSHCPCPYPLPLEEFAEIPL